MKAMARNGTVITSFEAVGMHKQRFPYGLGSTVPWFMLGTGMLWTVLNSRIL